MYSKQTQLGTKTKKKRRRSKLKDKSRAKECAWNAFSLYMRTKLCLETTGTRDWGVCYTCESRKHISEIQSGHFLDGRSGNVLFAEELIRLQCGLCNVVKHGNKTQYTLHMMGELGGVDEVHSLIKKYLRMPLKQYKLKDYLEIEQKYINLLKEL